MLWQKVLVEVASKNVDTNVPSKKRKPICTTNFLIASLSRVYIPPPHPSLKEPPPGAGGAFLTIILCLVYTHTHTHTHSTLQRAEAKPILQDLQRPNTKSRVPVERTHSIENIFSANSNALGTGEAEGTRHVYLELLGEMEMEEEDTSGGEEEDVVGHTAARQVSYLPVCSV
jgi:hypothetical protein